MLTRLILAIGFVLSASTLTGCSGHGCRHTDWCACSSGNECYQDCVDGDGCKFFCDHVTECGATCGNNCHFDFHDAKGCSADCGDNCTIACYDSTTCGAFCGANCNYSCYNMDLCSVRAGPNSVVYCNAKSCFVTCLGPCNVLCGQVDCNVDCPNGASPMSCTDGSVACGSC